LEFPDNFFDAIGLIYVHFPDTVRKSNHKHLIKLLNPKGSIILEAFSKNHLKCQKINPGVGGPKMPNQLYDTTELSNDFEGFDMVELKEEVIKLAEGTFHLGQSSVVRLHAQKKENNLF
jgi:hypothetical protein